MRKIVVIGNSPAGAKAIEAIRAVDQESPISIFSWETALPYNRFLFPDLLAGAVKEADVLYQPETFYKNLKVELRPDRNLVRLSPKRNRAVFEDKKEEKEEVNFDFLILAGAATKFPDIKGNHRSGIYGLRRLTEAQEILKNIPLADTVAVQTQSLWGLSVVEALCKKKKEVLWIHPGKSLFTPDLGEQAVFSLKQTLEAHGIRILEDNTIAEILGDSEAKAVRLKSGKVIGAEMIIFPDSGPDLKVYTEGGLASGERITINQNFQTNIENIFAVDEVCEFQAAYPGLPAQDSLSVLEEQGKAVAGVVTGKPYTLSLPANNSSLLAEIEKRFPGTSAPGSCVSLSESSG